MEENLKLYLVQHNTVLIRGIDIYPGLQYLKSIAPEFQKFTSDDEGVCQILVDLGFTLDSSGIYVAHGDGSDIEGLTKNKGILWYFQDRGPKGHGRYLDRYFDLVIGFLDNKLSGIKKSRFGREV